MNLQGRTLTPGSTGADVAELHAHLELLDYSVSADERKSSTFGEETLAAVQSFQTDIGLEVTGEIDARGVAALTDTVRNSTYEISGVVSSRNHAAVGRLHVEVVDQNVGGDIPVVSGETSDAGEYRLSKVIPPAVLRRRRKTRPDLQTRVSLRAPHRARTFLAASAVSYDAPNQVTLDVVLPATTTGLPSEYETLAAAIAHIYRGDLSDLKETADRQDLTFLANKTGWDARAVAMAALAHQFSRTLTAAGQEAGGPEAAGPEAAGPEADSTLNSGPIADGQEPDDASPTIRLKPAFYYALLRAGVPANADQLFAIGSNRAAAIWTQAVSQGVIPARLKADIPAATQAFQALAAGRVLSATPRIGVSSLAEQVSTVLTSTSQQAQFAQLLTQSAGNWSEFWTAAQTAFGQTAASQLQVLGQLQYLTLNNAPLVAALSQASPSVINAPQSLASEGFYDAAKWAPLIGDSVPSGTPGATTAEQAANYAAFLAAQVKLAFPTAVLSDQVGRGVIPIVAPAEVVKEVSNFLDANQQTFVIGAEPVEAFIARTKAAAPTPAALDQIKRLQRTYQLTTSDENMAVLLNHGLDSAYAITQYDSAGFVRAFGPQLGGAATAKSVHDRARQVFAGVLSLAASYGVALRGPPMGGNWNIIDNSSNSPPPSILPSATLQQLFGSLDYCNCEDCNSILSPAAYFVDLLHYLDQPSPSPSFTNPQTELFTRRPDLQYLALSCENTNTALPYIDLVNETLEAFVAGGLGLNGYEGFNASADITSAELIATPQNINDQAYAALQGAFFPAPLPFDRPLELLRQHMLALNTDLPDAMITLRASDALTNTSTPTSYGWSDILIEQLGLSRDEFRLFTDSGLGLGDLYGLPDATALATLQTMSLQDFSARTGVSYVDLVAILETQFVNPCCALIERVQALGMGFAAIQALQGAPSAGAAAFIDTLPAGLDYSQYGGTDGQAVVNWLTGPNYDVIMGLITIANPTGGQDDCSGSALQFRYANPDMAANLLTATDFLKLIRFIRLWSKLQALLQIGDDSEAIQATDALLCALYPATDAPVDSNEAANDATNRPLLDTGFKSALLRAGFAIEMLNRLSLDYTALTQLLTCWADIGTGGTDSLYASMFLTPTLLQQDPGAQAATVSPAVNVGDQLTTTIDTVPIVYTVAAGDTSPAVAIKIAAEINAATTPDPVSGAPLNQRVRAVADVAQVVVTAGFAMQWAVSGAGGASLTAAAVTDPTAQSATVSGAPAAGELFSVTIDTTSIAYVAQAADTPDTIAEALAYAINATTTSHVYSGLPLNSLLAASASGAIVTVRTADAGPPFTLSCAIVLASAASYAASAPVPAQAVVTLSGSTTAGDVVTFLLNGVAVNYTVAGSDTSLAILAGSLATAINSAVEKDPTTTLPFSELLHAASDGGALTLTPIDPSTAFTVTVSSNGSEQFAVTGPDPAAQSAAVSGTFPANAVLTTTINAAGLFYTVVAGDTASSIASNITAQINGASLPDPNTGLPLNTLVSASASGSTITLTAANATTPFTLAVSASQGAYTAGRLAPPFADNGYGVYLGDQTQTLFGHQPALCAACNLTGAEFSLITAALDFDATTKLTLDNVSALFRYGWLAHALGVSVLEFLALRRFSGLDPFAALDPSTTAPAEPPAIRLLQLVQAMANAGLAPIQALYLIWNQDVSGVLAPSFNVVSGLAQALCADFAAIEAQFTLQDDPDGSIAQQLMALVYGVSDTDFFFGLLNQTFSVSVPYSYASPVLPQPVLDASGGLLAYSDTAKSLSVSGLLTNLGEAAIAGAATVSTTDSADNLAAGQVTLTPASMTNIAPGAVLVIDSGAAQETVVVANTTATSFTTTTAQPHNGTVTPFAIANDPSLPAALTALAAASQQAVAPFFARYPELQALYTTYVASNAPVQVRRENLLASFLPTMVQLRKVEQALAEITAQIGCDPSFAKALLKDPAILHSDGDPTQPAVADLTGIEAGGLTAQLFLGDDPSKPPDQTVSAVGPVLYVQTATLGGALAVGAVLTTTINGTAVTYTTTASDTGLQELAQQAAAAINACTTVDAVSGLPINKLVTASTTGPTVILTPSQPLAATGVFTLACASSVAGLTYSAGSELPAGTGASGVAGSWSGYITPPQTGIYGICVVADAGAQVTLEIGGQVVAMLAGPGAADVVWSNQAEITLTAGQVTSVILSVTSLKTTLALGWRSPPGLGWTPIPATALFPAGPMQSLGATYVRFLKAVSVASALSLTADEIAWLGTDTTQTVETTSASVTTPGSATFTPASIANIAVGSSLVLDTGPAQETVNVTAVTATTFTATTANPHNGAVTAFTIVSAPQPVLNHGWLNLLPGLPNADPANAPTPDLATAAQLTLVLSAALDFARVKQALSPSDERLLRVLQNPAALLPNGQSALISLTGWAQLSVNALCAQFFAGAPPATAMAGVENFARVYDAMTLVQACRVNAPALLSAATNAPTPTTVSSLQSALRACYAASSWLTVVKPINDALRTSQRDALVAYILQGLAANPGNTITTADDLYASFLIDPSTEPPVLTSRIRLALSAVQLFVERILRALEPEVSPGDIDPQQWAWMKRYRVWEANREVFLWPENWLYPQLRDDQSPIFEQMMSTLLQSDITDDAATSAYLDYLSDLADVAKLEPCGLYYVPATADTDETTYVVSRSFGAHRKYYFRQLRGGSWTPWIKVPIDCEDMPVTPIVWNGRLFLFWLKTHKLSPITPAQATSAPSGNLSKLPVTSANLGEFASAGPQTAITQVTVQATLWWSEYYNGEWQSARSSDPNRPTTIGQFDPYGPNTFEAYRNQMAIQQVQCTGVFWTSDWVGPAALPPIPDGSLLLAITTPLNPFPRYPTAAGGSGFMLHNTHSAPIPFEDLNAGDGDIGLYLDLPAPGRQIQPPDDPYQQPAQPYTGGPDSDWLGIAYWNTLDDFENSYSEFYPWLLDYFWQPRIVEVQPGLPDAWYAPFIYEDRRNLFYVTTTLNQLTFYKWEGFGVGPVMTGRSPKAVQIPDLAFAQATAGDRITFTLPSSIRVSYQGTQILSSGGSPTPAPVQKANSAR